MYSMAAELFHVADKMKLIVTFYNFENMPKNVFEHEYNFYHLPSPILNVLRIMLNQGSLTPSYVSSIHSYSVRKVRLHKSHSEMCNSSEVLAIVC